MEEMVVSLSPMLEHHRNLASMYGKPYHFGETGCCSAVGATRKPYGLDTAGGYDGDEQANFVEAAQPTFWNETW